jgi:hypothetical protein
MEKIPENLRIAALGALMVPTRDLFFSVANAILAERKRCAGIAQRHARSAQRVLESVDGFSDAHWNGRLFASESILGDIEERP